MYRKAIDFVIFSLVFFFALGLMFSSIDMMRYLMLKLASWCTVLWKLYKKG